MARRVGLFGLALLAVIGYVAWGNGGQEQYIRAVQQHLAGEDWTKADFIHWTPGSFPPGVRFN